MNIKILSRQVLEQILEMPRVIQGVESVYKLKAKGEAVAWPLVEHHFAENAVTDIRSGGAFGEVDIHGAKLLNNFPANEEKGLPVFTGVLMAFDSKTGIPLGVMDASYITCMRTGAAGAIGIRTLARKDARVLTIVGAGRQAFFQAGAALAAMPQLTRVQVVDPMDFSFAEKFAADTPVRLQKELGIDAGETCFVPVKEMEQAIRTADCIITITRATVPLFRKEWVRPGTAIACISADMVGKEEIDPELFRDARVFCDDIAQCCRVGESEIPFKNGVITEDGFAGEIGQVLAGDVPGRLSDEDITIFDATGLAALDLVTAKVAVELANEQNKGVTAEI